MLKHSTFFSGHFSLFSLLFAGLFSHIQTMPLNYDTDQCKSEIQKAKKKIKKKSRKEIQIGFNQLEKEKKNGNCTYGVWTDSTHIHNGCA